MRDEQEGMDLPPGVLVGGLGPQPLGPGMGWGGIGGGGGGGPFCERSWREWPQPPSGGALTLSFLYTVRMQLKVFP